MHVLELVFYFCLAVLGYVYLGYPLLCWLLAGVLNRRLTGRISGQLPQVTVLVAAYNEAQHIVTTIRNKLELDYPSHLLEVIVISDGSDDGTDDLVRGLQDDRLHLLRQQPRAGKTAALNMAVPTARGELLVFSDANSLYAPSALRELVQLFEDAEVGYVTGRMVYKAPDGSLTGQGCSAYMRYENALRAWETRLGSIVGVDGGIDAVRKDLYVPMRPDQLPDFVLPLAVREQDWRVVYAPRALLYEDALATAEDEFRMRVRVTLRAWHALRDKVALLNPFRYGIFSWQLFSHKWLRYLAPFFQICLFMINIPLAVAEPGWWVVLLMQVAFYVTAWCGFLGRRRDLPWPLTFAYYLCLINAASAVAFLRFLKGDKQVVWQPRT